MSRKTILIAVAAISATCLSGSAMARQGNNMRQGQNNGMMGQQRPVMMPQDQGQMQGQGQNSGMGSAAMDDRMQDRIQNRIQAQEERMEKACSRGEDMVANMKRRNRPSELVSMVERHTQERCEMNRRQFQERNTVMEELRQQGVQIDPAEGLVDEQ